MSVQYQVGIIGGGLAGLCSAIHLSKLGISCIVWEKGEYPRHKVCGEYVSTETLNYLSFLGFDPFEYGAVKINEFQVSHWNGDITHAQLDLGAFGLSRFVFDDALYRLALKNNATVNSMENVTEVEKTDSGFAVRTNKSSYTVNILLSAHGKKSNVDRLLNREFFHKDSDYIGVKYHYRFVIPPQQVSLHNFENGYCGVSMIEDQKINVCYLTTKSMLKEYRSIEEMEKQVLHKNPYLKDLFENGENLFEEPKTISDFSFRSKTAVEDGILMIGDSAGLITPLCGNGMAMAIHAAYIVSNLLYEFFQNKITKHQLESQYTDAWKEHFRSRIDFGYNVQKLFGKKTITSVALKSLQIAPFLLPVMIKKTHGKDFFTNGLPGKDFFSHD